MDDGLSIQYLTETGNELWVAERFRLGPSADSAKRQDVNKGRGFFVHFNRNPPTRTLQYLSEAMTAFVLYEYLLTLPDEVSR